MVSKSSHNECRRVCIINGDKGGVSKSFNARVIASKLLDAGASLVVIDGDSRNAHLDRFLCESVPVTRCDLRTEHGWSTLIDQVDAAAKDALILVDLPAGAGEALGKELPRLHLMLDEDGSELFHIWAADPSEDAVRLFRELYEVASPRNTAFVMSLRGQIDVDHFKLWHNSKTRERFMAEGGVEAAMPGLATAVVDRFAMAHVPFHKPGDVQMTRSEQLTFKMWWASIDTVFGPVINLLTGGTA